MITVSIGTQLEGPRGLSTQVQRDTLVVIGFWDPPNVYPWSLHSVSDSESVTQVGLGPTVHDLTLSRTDRRTRK